MTGGDMSYLDLALNPARGRLYGNIYGVTNATASKKELW